MGLSLLPADGAVMIAQVYANGPAASAGVSVGDDIVSIDGRPCAGESLAKTTARLSGKIGDPVLLDLCRPDGSAYQVRLQCVSPLKIGGGFVASEGVLPSETLATVREAFNYARYMALKILGNPTLRASESFEEWLATLPDDGETLFRGGSESFLVTSWVEDGAGLLLYTCSATRTQGKWGIDTTPDGKVLGNFARDLNGETSLADFATGYAGFPAELRSDKYAAEEAIRTQYLVCIQVLAGILREGLADALYMQESETWQEWLLRIGAASSSLKAWVDANERRSVPDGLGQVHSDLCTRCRALHDELLTFESRVRSVIQFLVTRGFSDIESLARDAYGSLLVLQSYDTQDACEAALSQLGTALSGVQNALGIGE